MKAKTISNLSKVLKERPDDIEKIPKEELRGVMDATNVMMFIPKTKHSQTAFEIFEAHETTVPKLGKEGMVTSRFSKEYLKVILKTLIEDCNDDDGVTLTLGDDKPLVIEDGHYGFMLAPRVSDEGTVSEVI